MALALARPATTTSDVLPPSLSSLCLTASSAPKVAVAVGADHVFVVQVPNETPTFGTLAAQSFAVKKDDVIEFDVSTARSGAVAVHGLFDPLTVIPGAVTRVKLKAIYSGRFPLHFHGDDGSHFEIAALEIRGGTAAPQAPN